ncbi:hypothetical protein AAD050_25155 [Enterobacter hormaechei]
MLSLSEQLRRFSQG